MRITFDTDVAPAGAPSNLQLGYFFFRLFAGVNLFFHGFMRILNGVGTWEGPVAATFEGLYLPMPLVHFFLYLVPWVEVALGALMILGLFTRWAFIGGLVLMLLLLYGQTVRQNWAGCHICMHYGLYYWIMLVLIKQNWMALDNARGAKNE